MKYFKGDNVQDGGWEKKGGKAEKGKDFLEDGEINTTNK